MTTFSELLGVIILLLEYFKENLDITRQRAYSSLLLVPISIQSTKLVHNHYVCACVISRTGAKS